DEATTLDKYETTDEQLKQTEEKIKQVKETKSTLDKEERRLNETKTRLTIYIENLHEKITLAKEMIAEHKGSHHIKEKIEANNVKNQSLQNEQNDVQNKVDELKQTIEQLRQNKVISQRQQVGLADLQRKGINAYSLRDLLELSPKAPLQLEDQLAAIKYTI